MNNNVYFVSFLLAIFFLSTNVVANNPGDSIFQANRLLARTINIGYMIEDNQQTGLKDSIFSQLDKVKKAGFTAVRLPIHWISAMDSLNSWKIDPSFLNLIDQVTQKALSLHLAVILDNHSDEQLMNDPALYGIRIFRLWEQLSVHYKNVSDSLMFELLAEPHGHLNDYWNMLITELLKIIRVTNPARPVIVGPINFNRPDFLDQLHLPEQDRHMIVSFHQYNPVRFTMQGETWFPFGRPLEWLGTPWPQQKDEESLVRIFNQVEAWSSANDRPIFMGEFGVSSMAEMASASRWIAFNRSQAEKRGFTWGFWSCFGIEFNLYKTATQSWNTRFLEALLPDLYQR